MGRDDYKIGCKSVSDPWPTQQFYTFNENRMYDTQPELVESNCGLAQLTSAISVLALQWAPSPNPKYWPFGL